MSTAKGLRMSVRRMSVKLIPRLASTGPRLNTTNSATNGRASIHAATACCRRVGSTWREGVPRPGAREDPDTGGALVEALMSQTGADLGGLALHLRDGVLDGRVALGRLLHLAVDDGGDLLPRRHGRRGDGVVELLAEDAQLRVLGELAGVPGGGDGRKV